MIADDRSDFSTIPRKKKKSTEVTFVFSRSKYDRLQINDCTWVHLLIQ